MRTPWATRASSTTHSSLSLSTGSSRLQSLFWSFFFGDSRDIGHHCSSNLLTTFSCWLKAVLGIKSLNAALMLMKPFCRYSYCSLSNILSSWCQYEALKYISFPTQVLLIFAGFHRNSFSRQCRLREGIKKSIFLGNSPKQRTPPTHPHGLGLT